MPDITSATPNSADISTDHTRRPSKKTIKASPAFIKSYSPDLSTELKNFPHLNLQAYCLGVPPNLLVSYDLSAETKVSQFFSFALKLALIINFEDHVIHQILIILPCYSN